VPQGGAALWRLDVNVAGSGVTGDLLAHSIDTAMWLNGPITRVVAKTETFIKERQHTETGRVEPVGIDDACMFLAEFANGSMGTFESTRYARGRKNFNTLELNGADGSVAPWHAVHAGVGNCINATTDGPVPCEVGQSCFWFSNGCSIGCDTCDGGNSSGTNPNVRDRCNSGAKARSSGKTRSR